MEAAIAYAILAAVVVGAGMTMRAFSPRAKAKRAIQRAQRKRIADVKDGEVVKICGTLRFGSVTLEAPITGRVCAGYEVTLREDGRKYDRAERDDSKCVPFVVEDGSGRAWVEPTIVDLLVRMDHHVKTGHFTDPTPRVREFLAGRGIDPKGTVLNRDLSFREGVLEEGEEVAVLGIARWEPDPDPTTSADGGYRERALRLRVSDPPGYRAIISDDPSVLD